jgi:ParB-like chromosome segregation protein Spo0J
MKTIKVAVDKLTPLEKNPRKHSAVQIEQLVRSIQMFGQIRPIVIDENNSVLAGNGLLMALKSMDSKEAECLQMTGLSETAKKRLTLADNKVASLGTDDYSVIEELIHDLKDELDIPGFDDEILKTLVAAPARISEISSSYGQVDEDFRAIARANAEKIAIANAEVEARVKSGSSEPTGSGSSSAEIKTCDSCGQRIWS